MKMILNQILEIKFATHLTMLHLETSDLIRPPTGHPTAARNPCGASDHSFGLMRIVILVEEMGALVGIHGAMGKVEGLGGLLGAS